MLAFGFGSSIHEWMSVGGRRAVSSVLHKPFLLIKIQEEIARQAGMHATDQPTSQFPSDYLLLSLSLSLVPSARSVIVLATISKYGTYLQNLD